MASLRDGLGFDIIEQSGLALNNSAYFTGSVTAENSLRSPTIIGTTTVSGAAFAGATFTDARGQLGPHGTGSPVTWGLSVQCGSAIASNVAVTVTFGRAFLATPIVQVTPAGSTTIAGNASGTTTTAFGLFGNSGTVHFWTATGSL